MFHLPMPAFVGTDTDKDAFLSQLPDIFPNGHKADANFIGRLLLRPEVWPSGCVAKTSGDS